MFEIVNDRRHDQNLKSQLRRKPRLEKLHTIMQSWVIKIDIKLNIDDLNWSLDGQIIDNTEQENVYLAYPMFLTRSGKWESWAENRDKMRAFIFHG